MYFICPKNSTLWSIWIFLNKKTRRQKAGGSISKLCGTALIMISVEHVPHFVPHFKSLCHTCHTLWHSFDRSVADIVAYCHFQGSLRVMWHVSGPFRTRSRWLSSMCHALCHTCKVCATCATLCGTALIVEMTSFSRKTSTTIVSGVV